MKYIKKVSASYQGDTPIATSITSSSTNDEVAGAKAVYDIAQDNYSTTEQKIGTWINGKPLYERVIEIAPQTFPANSVTGVQHNIANFEFGFVVNGGFYYTSGTTGLNTYMIGNYYANSTSYTQNAVFYISIVNINSTVIGVANSYTYSSTLVNGGFAVVRYTKTTDSATRSLNLMRSAKIEKETKEIEQPLEEVTDKDVGEIEAEKTTPQNEGSGDTLNIER